MVGRTEELAHLIAPLLPASELPGLFLVTGEAGIGKTRLILELARHTVGLGGIPLIGRCVVAGVPFAPLTEALRGLTKFLDEQSLASVLGPGRAELGRLIEPTARDSDSVSMLATESSIFEYALGALIRLGNHRPVALMIEDAHWADETTKGLIRFLAEKLQVPRVIFVVTCRSDAPRASGWLSELRATFGQLGGEAVELQPLSREQVSDLLAFRAGGAVDETMAREIHERGGGNPFFCELLQDERTLGQAPAEKDAVLSRWIERVSIETRRVLEYVAVVGQAPSERFLRALTADVKVKRSIKEAIDAHLLVPTGTGFWFRHSLFQTALLNGLLVGERAALHKRIAETLSAEPTLSGGTHESVAVRLANHWYEAGDRLRAVKSAVEAALTIERASPREALKLYESALHLGTRLTEWPAETPDRVSVLKCAAEAAFSLGDVDRAQQLIDRAMSEWTVSSSSSKSILLEHLGRYLEEAGDASSHRCFEDALSELSIDAEPLSRIPVLSSSGLSRVRRGEFESGIALLSEARVLAENESNSDLLSVALGNLSEAFLSGSQLDAAIDAARGCRRSALRSDNKYQVINSYLTESRAVYRKSGRLEDSIALRRVALHESERFGQALTGGAAVRLALLEDLIEYGSWAEAEALLEGRAKLDRGSLSVADGLLAEYYLALRRSGRVMSIPSLVELTSTDDPQFGSYFLSLGIPIAAGSGSLAQVRALSARALALRDAHPAPAACLYLTDALASAIGAEADLEQNASVRSRQVDILIRAAEDVFRVGRTCIEAELEFTDGIIEVARAEASRARGSLQTGAWSRAIDIFRKTHARGRLAYSLMRQFEVMTLAARRNKKRLRAMFKDAFALTEELGARPWQEELQSLAHSVGVKSEIEGELPISMRELAVLALVAEGLTDKVIAETMFVSVRTVNTHVGHILTKLGVYNRTAAADRFRKEGWGTHLGDAR